MKCPVTWGGFNSLRPWALVTYEDPILESVNSKS